MLATLISLFLSFAMFVPGHSTARDIRLLSIQAAQSGRVVRLEGIVTFCPPRGSYFYLQDQTGGVRVEWLADRELRPGERVVVHGKTSVGSFLPEVIARDVRSLDDQPPHTDKRPEPVPYTLTLDDAPYMDGQWVEVVGVVQRVWKHEGWLQLDLARGRGHAVVYVPLPLPAEVKLGESFAGAVMKIRGVCRVNVNEARQMAGPPRILVNGLQNFEMVPWQRINTETAALTTARELAGFNADPIQARLPVRIAGIVTANLGGKHFYIYDGSGVVQAITTEAVEAWPGDEVIVTGYPRLATDPVRLENAQVRVGGTAQLPPPQSGTPLLASEGKLEGKVVTFIGVVHEVSQQGNWQTVTLVADGLTFTVVLLENNRSGRSGEPIVPGSRIEVTGVVLRQPLEGVRRTAFSILSTTPQVTVLETPPEPVQSSWWTGQRIAYFSAGFLGLFLIGGAAVTTLRMQVRRATSLVRKQYEEKERLEGQLKLAARLETVGRLAGGIAHDFNNLLTVINGCAQLLDDEIRSDPPHAALLAGEIRHAGEQAAALTRQLLTFSRQRAITPHPLDLNAVVTDASQVLVRLMGERVTMRVITEPNLPQVLAESGLISQIMLNFAVNARDAMPNGGLLTFTTSQHEAGWVRLSASDTGVGMSEQVQARLFEPFFTTKEVGKGTGLGLSTVYGIVKSLNGKIRFHSELGVGTTFEVDLPIYVPKAAPGSHALTPLCLGSVSTPEAPTETISIADTQRSVPAPQPLAAVDALLASATVLVVEDDEAVRSLVCHVLEQAGITVLAATEPADALAMLERYDGPIDLLITDVVMPGASGRQLAERVRETRPKLNVLFMSGYTSDEVLLQDLQEDPSHFIHKPFVPRQLLERVRSLLLTQAREQGDPACTT